MHHGGGVRSLLLPAASCFCCEKSFKSTCPPALLSSPPVFNYCYRGPTLLQGSKTKTVMPVSTGGSRGAILPPWYRYTLKVLVSYVIICQFSNCKEPIRFSRRTAVMSRTQVGKLYLGHLKHFGVKFRGSASRLQQFLWLI